MILKNPYYYFSKALTDVQCDMILAHGKQKLLELLGNGESTHAKIGDGDDGLLPPLNGAISAGSKTAQALRSEKKPVYHRDSEVAFLSDSWVYDIINPYVMEANHKANWNFEWDWNESIQFTKYGVGQFYGWHSDAFATPYKMDMGEFSGKIRKLSVTINLSDPKDYKGGNLRFDFGPHDQKKRFHTCTEIRPRGSIIVFPSHIYHQVTPVTKGTRHSLVMWSLGLPFR